MRNNTRKIFERLSKGAFIAVDSIDIEVKRLFTDVEENFDDYESYFRELGYALEAGDGYFFFSRLNESRLTIEQKLQSFGQWIDIIDFLKTYDVAFSTGYQFRASTIVERLGVDVELREKAGKLFRKQKNTQEIAEKLIAELESMGYAELIDDKNLTYKVTAAFRYVEELVNLIVIYNEDDTPEP